MGMIQKEGEPNGLYLRQPTLASSLCRLKATSIPTSPPVVQSIHAKTFTVYDEILAWYFPDLYCSVVKLYSFPQFGHMQPDPNHQRNLFQQANRRPTSPEQRWLTYSARCSAVHSPEPPSHSLSSRTGPRTSVSAFISLTVKIALPLRLPLVTLVAKLV